MELRPSEAMEAQPSDAKSALKSGQRVICAAMAFEKEKNLEFYEWVKSES